MKAGYLVLILASVIALGWVIHHYSDNASFGSAGTPRSIGMRSAPAPSAG